MAVSHFIFGARVRAAGNGTAKEYRYPGLIEKLGVVWLGQSVFLLTPQRSVELRQYLGAKGVAHERIFVRVT